MKHLKTIRAEEVNSVDLTMLRKVGALEGKPGERVGRAILRNNNGTDEAFNAYVTLNSIEGIASFKCPRLEDGTVEFFNSQATLVSAPCRFGGKRWWFVCDGCKKRARILYAPAGIFRCRDCHHLWHKSQGYVHRKHRMVLQHLRADELRASLKRVSYRDKPTKKYLRYLKLREDGKVFSCNECRQLRGSAWASEMLERITGESQFGRGLQWRLYRERAKEYKLHS